MNDVPEPGELDVTLASASRSCPRPSLPSPRRRSSSMPHARARRPCPETACRQPRTAIIWLVNNLQFEQQPVSAAWPARGASFASLATSETRAKPISDSHASEAAAGCRRVPAGSQTPIKWAASGIAGSAWRHCIRPAGGVGYRLNPPRLVVALSRRQLADIDGFQRYRSRRCRCEFIDRIVAADRLVRPEDARHLRPTAMAIVEPPD